MEFDITAGPVLTPLKVVLYGPEGIGKSTFAAKFPHPLFIDTEESTKMMDVRRFPKPEIWTELLQMVDYVKVHPDVCSTLIIDTADWAERLCEAAICQNGAKKSIEDFGYGKGYTMVAEEFGHLLDNLTDVVAGAKINVVLTAHSVIRKFERPDEMGAYDRYELKLGNKAGSKCSALVKEWCDVLLFANYKEIVSDVNGKKKAQGGRRVMYTSHHPCWDAKNRLDLKDELPFDFQEIAPFIVDFHAKQTTEKEEKKEHISDEDAKAAAARVEAREQANAELAKSFEAKDVTKKKAVEIEQVVLGKSPSEAIEAVANADVNKLSQKGANAVRTKAGSLQDKVLANAAKAGVNPLDLAIWAVNAGCLAKDEKAFPEHGGVMPVEKWPDKFIEEVIIPNWSKVVAGAKEVVPF